jgi:hypothetical protein
VSYDGRRILTASSDQTAIVWGSANISPTITLAEQSLEYTKAGEAVAVDDKAVVFDPDAPHFGGGRLTVQLVTDGAPAGEEQVTIPAAAAGAGNVGLAGDKVVYDFGDGAGPVAIGTVSGAGDQPGALTVTFTERATREAVESLVRHVLYTSRVPLTAERKVRLILTDGDGEPSQPAERTILPPAREGDKKPAPELAAASTRR